MPNTNDAPQLVRDIDAGSNEATIYYTLNDGTYVGSITVRCRHSIEVWQMLAYDLLQIISALAQKQNVPEPNTKNVMKGTA